MNYQRENYSLNIISKLPDFNGKSLKKYKLEGIETVGAWGNEPFEIQFKNHTYQKIQVKISLDGTDILTGQPATSEATGQMWVVNGYETLTLKAWPESNNGGAGFVFTSGDKSVALHTHGDVSHRGIIAAAVFTEGHVEPVRINNHHHHHHYKYYDYYWSSPIWIGDITFGSSTGDNFNGVYGGGTRGLSSGTLSFNATCDAAPASANYLNDSVGESKGLESLASVGAGSYTDQKITYATGLIKPLLSETVRVKYIWWDDLKAALQKNAIAPAPQPSGFPGDRPLMSLGATPRVDTRNQSTSRIQEQLQFSRF